jgi:hypothetical protein
MSSYVDKHKRKIVLLTVQSLQRILYKNVLYRLLQNSYLGVVINVYKL